jgi:hypothetical protein
VCVCAFSLRRESPDMILGDKPFIFEVVLSQGATVVRQWRRSEEWASHRCMPRGNGLVLLFWASSVNLSSHASYRHDDRGPLPTDLVVTERIFLVNGGAFAARRLRVYIRNLYNRFVTYILVRIQLG